MNSSKQIKWGAIISYLAIFINIAAMLLYTPWMKDQIGIENYGLYTLANSFIAMFLMDFGIGSAVSRFISKYRAEGNIEAANNFMGLVCKLFIIIDIIIFSVLIILFFFIERIYQGLTAAELDIFKNLYLVIAAFSIFSFPFTTLNGLFNAYEKFIPLKICDLLQKLTSILFIVAALLNKGDVVAMVTAHAFSGIIVVIIKLIIVKRTIPIKPNFRIRDKALVNELLGFSIWVTVLGVAQRLTYNVAPSILGIVSNSREIALYSPASAIAGYFYTFATAINGLFLPTISNKIAQKKENEILPLMIGVGRFQVVVLGMLYVGFATIGREFMILWMGKEFEISYYCVLLLAFPTIFEYSQQIANTTIIAKNKVKQHSIGLLASALVNIMVSPFLSHFLGSVGVCIGIVIAAAFNFVYLNVIYYRVLNINVFTFYRECYLPIFIPIVAGIAISMLISTVIPIVGWLGIVIKGLISVVVFFMLVFIFHIKKSEKKRIVDAVLKRIRKA